MAYSHEGGTYNKSLDQARKRHVRSFDGALDHQQLVLLVANSINILDQWILPSQHLNSQVSRNELPSEVDSLVSDLGCLFANPANILGQK